MPSTSAVSAWSTGTGPGWGGGPPSSLSSLSPGSSYLPVLTGFSLWLGHMLLIVPGRSASAYQPTPLTLGLTHLPLLAHHSSMHRCFAFQRAPLSGRLRLGVAQRLLRGPVSRFPPLNCGSRLLLSRLLTWLVSRLIRKGAMDYSGVKIIHLMVVYMDLRLQLHPLPIEY